jgi:polar amino acid transport system substrate-binding protein
LKNTVTSRAAVAVVTAVMLWGPPATLADTLTVGVKHTPPFVIVDSTGGAPRGFSIELVEAVARTMEPPREVRYHVDADLVSHLESVKSGKVDLGIAATSITSGREAWLDFSQPFFRDGLALLVPRRRGMVRSLFSHDLIAFILAWKGMSGLFLGILFYLFVCANLIWLVERGQHFSRRWLEGVGQGMWWTVVTMSTVGYGDFYPKKPLGRVIGSGVVFSGIILFGVAIAGLSSFLTVNQLVTGVKKLDDLEGKPIAAIRGSVGAQFLAKRGMDVYEAGSVDDAVRAVLRRRAAGAVHDASVLRYYLQSRPGLDRKLALTGERLKDFSYGITLPEGRTELREQVDIALLKLTEGDDAPYRRLRDKWFPESGR